METYEWILCIIGIVAGLTALILNIINILKHKQSVSTAETEIQ